MSIFKAACIQLNSGNDLNANMQQAAALVRDAAQAGGNLIMLPENCFMMEAPGAATARQYAEADHPAIIMARGLAREIGAWLLLGSVAVVAEDASGKLCNRSLLIDSKGNVAGRYDKIHLFDVELPGGERYAESARMTYGAKAEVATTPWGKLGMSVCYDVRFPHLYRQMAKAGADFISVPAAFTVITGAAHWHVLLRARAIENGCYLFAPAQAGTHPGDRRTYGHALIINPWGEIIAERAEDVGFIMADIDTAKVQEARSRLPSLSHDRDYTMS